MADNLKQNRNLKQDLTDENSAAEITENQTAVNHPNEPDDSRGGDDNTTNVSRGGYISAATLGDHGDPECSADANAVQDGNNHPENHNHAASALGARTESSSIQQPTEEARNASPLTTQSSEYHHAG